VASINIAGEKENPFASWYLCKYRHQQLLALPLSQPACALSQSNSVAGAAFLAARGGLFLCFSALRAGQQLGRGVWQANSAIVT